MAAVHWIVFLTVTTAAFLFSVDASKIMDSIQPSIDDYFVPRQDMQDLNPPNYDEYSEMNQVAAPQKYPSFYSLKELLALNAIRNANMDPQARRFSSVHSRQTGAEAEQNEIPTDIKPYQNKHIQVHEQKRNAGNNNYYMSLCHFKICNMGRKRNTRFLQ